MADIIVLAVAAPILLFLLICWLLRIVFLRLSGWNTLRASYAAQSPDGGWSLRGQSATVGPIRFRRIVRAACTDRGLYLAVSGLAPLPPVCIPWAHIRAVHAAEFYRKPVFRLTLDPPSPTLQVSPALMASIRPRLPRAVLATLLQL